MHRPNLLVICGKNKPQPHGMEINGTRGKVDYVLFLLAHIERIPEKFLKHIEGQKGLYELRIEVGSDIFRVFCCFDKEKIVVLLNSFQTKTQKTPSREIDLAAKLMNEYFNKQ